MPNNECLIQIKSFKFYVLFYEFCVVANALDGFTLNYNHYTVILQTLVCTFLKSNPDPQLMLISYMSTCPKVNKYNSTLNITKRAEFIGPDMILCDKRIQLLELTGSTG